MHYYTCWIVIHLFCILVLLTDINISFYIKIIRCIKCLSCVILNFSGTIATIYKQLPFLFCAGSLLLPVHRLTLAMWPAHIGTRQSWTNEVGPLCHIILSTYYEVPSTIKIWGQGINDIIFMDARALLERIILLKTRLGSVHSKNMSALLAM